MADRFPPLDPPVRYPRYVPKPDDTDTGKEENTAVVRDRPAKSRIKFKIPKIKEYWVTGDFDMVFFTVAMLLLALGLVMLLSASYPTAYYRVDNSYSYFNKQLGFALFGIAVMFFVSKIDYKIYKDYAIPFLILSLVLLVVVLFYHTDKTASTGEEFKRYIPIFGFSFQPSEIAKFALIVIFSVYFSKYAKEINAKGVKAHLLGLVPPILMIVVFCVLVGLENHVSCMALMFFIAASIMFVGGTKKWVFWLGGILMVAAIIVLFQVDEKMLPEYVHDKIVFFKHKDIEPLGGRWQINNSLYAIGSGGLFGVGLGNSKQKYMYVSEPQNDFIFSIVCEELGFVGALIIIILFVVLILRGIQISLKARDKIGSFIALGITAQIGIQTVLNILVVTDSIPNTGIALPFFSYGGSALLMLLFETGVMLNISRKANQRKV